MKQTYVKAEGFKIPLMYCRFYKSTDPSIGDVEVMYNFNLCEYDESQNLPFSSTTYKCGEWEIVEEEISLYSEMSLIEYQDMLSKVRAEYSSKAAEMRLELTIRSYKEVGQDLVESFTDKFVNVRNEFSEDSLGYALTNLCIRLLTCGNINLDNEPSDKWTNTLKNEFGVRLDMRIIREKIRNLINRGHYMYQNLEEPLANARVLESVRYRWIEDQIEKVLGNYPNSL